MLVTCFLFSCQQPYNSHVKSSLLGQKYIQSFEVGNHRIKVQYVPRVLKLLMHSRMDSNSRISNSLLDSLEKDFGESNGITFVLHLEPKDASSGPGFESDLIYGNMSGYGNYQEALQAFAFGLKEKIWLEVNESMLPMRSYQMENTFGMTRGRTFVLLFSKPPGFEKGAEISATLVLDNIVPGLARKKMEWTFPVGKYDESI